mgnify:CR=1 FL=1
MNDRVYKIIGQKYGPEEYERDKKEWDMFCQSNDNGYKEYFKNDAYCARDRMDAYEKGENPLHANATYQNNKAWVQAYIDGCGCFVIILFIAWIIISSVF